MSAQVTFKGLTDEIALPQQVNGWSPPLENIRASSRPNRNLGLTQARSDSNLGVTWVRRAFSSNQEDLEGVTEGGSSSSLCGEHDTRCQHPSPALWVILIGQLGCVLWVPPWLQDNLDRLGQMIFMQTVTQTCAPQSYKLWEGIPPWFYGWTWSVGTE